MNRRAFRSIGVLVVLVSSCASKGPEEKVAEPIRPVRTLEVFSTGGERVRKFAGVTQAGMESKLSFKVGGTVEKLRIKIGQKVAKGEVLAELDALDFRLQLQQAEAALAQAEAMERNANSTYERTRSLYESRTASRSDLDAARAAHESAQASVQSVGKQTELARSQLRYTKLRAPSAGVISRCPVEMNENVKPGKVVLHLSSDSMPEVKVTVPEAFISQLHSGDRASVTLGSVKGTTFAATLSEVGVAAESLGSTFPVIARLDETSPAVRPGMAAEVAIQFAGAGGPERYVVPAIAVTEDREGRFVFVVEEIRDGKGVVKRREVQTGELSSDGLEVVSGLSDGDRLVTAGVNRIRDGLVVKLMGK